MDYKKDVAYDIIEERLEFAIELMNKIKTKYKLTLTDAETIENARNLAISMFIQKESARRMKK